MSWEPRIEGPNIDRLFDAINTLETREEFYRFFEDLCTINELQAIAQRFKAAEMLAGGSTYDEVAQETGMSSATISRINQFLRYGAGGYKLAMKRLQQEP